MDGCWNFHWVGNQVIRKRGLEYMGEVNGIVRKRGVFIQMFASMKKKKKKPK